MSSEARIIIVGPEDRLTITPPKAPREPSGASARIATTRLDEAEGGEVVLAINGHVRKLRAFEEIIVSSEVLALLEDCGYEIEHVEEEPQA